jgi:hypothetical protein
MIEIFSQINLITLIIMLRQQLSSYKCIKTPEKAIKLPKQNNVEETKLSKSNACSIDNLEEMCNFNNDPISCTPPDGYFMQNLRLRMEKA